MNRKNLIILFIAILFLIGACSFFSPTTQNVPKTSIPQGNPAQPETATQEPLPGGNGQNESQTPIQGGGDLGSQLEMVSLNPDGQPLNGNSDAVAVSDNGLYVAFTSAATNLVPEKTTNTYTDVFVYNHASKKIVMVSVSTDGQEGNNSSYQPEISDDGRFVVFSSTASNLVPNDNNGKINIFIHDRDSDGNGVFDEPGGTKTELVSVSINGGVGNDDSWDPHLHGSGRFIAFFSRASDLVSGDTSQCSIYDLGDTTCTNVYVRDIQTSKTVRVSVSSTGELENQAPDTCELGPDISSDGRFVVFPSAATNLVSGKTNTCENNNISIVSDQSPCQDIFLHDTQTGETTRLSVGANGEQGDEEAARPVISSNGRYVAFESLATNLVPDLPKDISGNWVVYVVDTQTHEIKIGSVNSEGQPVNGSDPVISADGRFVGFLSSSYKIVTTNPPSDSSREDFYIHDFQTGTTYLVSEGIGGPGVSAKISAGNSHSFSVDEKWAVFIAGNPLTGIELPAKCAEAMGEGEVDNVDCNAIYLRDLSGMFK